MKIEGRHNVKGRIKTIVSFKNERYVRWQKDVYNGLQMGPVIEWKKEKTNHLVKADKSKILEEQFLVLDKTTKPVYDATKSTMGGGITCSSGTTMFFDYKQAPEEKSFKEKKIDEEIIRLCKAGTLLAAIKYYKDMNPGVGLKEAKDYVDVLHAGVIAEKKWSDFATTETLQNQKDKEVLIACGRFFKKNSEKVKFINDYKRYLKETGSLQVVKSIKEKTGWGLYEAKVFFDTYIK
jgi:ribosomal protein L7/L12